MSTAFQRGLVLFQQGRHDLADREFREELSNDPDNPTAHAFLALCMHERKRTAESLAEAGEAVRLAPDDPFGHYVRGLALLAAKDYREAETEAHEAIRLDPHDANSLGLLANIAIARGRWADALEASERGLTVDPENASCANLRSLALVQLGRKDEAAASLGSALADDPENPLTHANQGWAYLHQGDHVRALEHFREALRIDPELEWARVGIVEALKARHLFYRLMLRFALWMGRKSRFVQIAVLLGLLFGQKVMAQAAEAVPASRPFLTPALFLLIGFVLMTWVASPLFNLLLRFNRFGRMALSREQTVESSWIGVFFILGAVGLAVYLATKDNIALASVNNLAFLSMATFGPLVLPLAVTFGLPAGRPRLLMGTVTVGIAALILPLWAHLFLGNASPLGNLDRSFECFAYFIRGVVFSTWVPALFSLWGR